MNAAKAEYSLKIKKEEGNMELQLVFPGAVTLLLWTIHIHGTQCVQLDWLYFVLPYVLSALCYHPGPYMYIKQGMGKN